MFPERMICPEYPLDESRAPWLFLDRYDHESVDATELYHEFYSGSESDQVFEHFVHEVPENLEETHAMVDRAIESWEEGRLASYAIRRVDDEFVGRMSYSIDWDLESAHGVIWLRRKYWGRGIGMVSFIAGAMLVFDHLDLEVVESRVVEGNDRMLNAMDSLTETYFGEHDGLLRHAALVDGEPVDVHRYSFTKDGYEDVIERGMTGVEYLEGIEVERTSAREMP
jgi:RimJ/RimL family protein N-acetyltransferase